MVDYKAIYKDILCSYRQQLNEKKKLNNLVFKCNQEKYIFRNKFNMGSK